MPSTTMLAARPPAWYTTSFSGPRTSTRVDPCVEDHLNTLALQHRLERASPSQDLRGREDIPCCGTASLASRGAGTPAPAAQPIGPPPITASLAIGAVRLNTDSLVIGAAAASPGMGGTTGRAPVAITARWKRSRLSRTSRVSESRKRPSPRKTSTPRLRNLSAES